MRKRLGVVNLAGPGYRGGGVAATLAVTVAVGGFADVVGGVADASSP